MDSRLRYSCVVLVFAAGAQLTSPFCSNSVVGVNRGGSPTFFRCMKRERLSSKTSMPPLGMIVSPFDNGSETETESSVESSSNSEEEILDLTWDNVDLVLEEMRPFLIQDGGNVAISDIDGPVVKLELQGNCGSCPSSTMTMRMGLERKLRERIPEIQEVVQAIPDGPELNEEQIDVVLDGVRPFLQVAGGTIRCVSITGIGGFSPVIMLKMEGKARKLRSVQKEIVQRLQRHFMIPMLRIEFDEDPF